MPENIEIGGLIIVPIREISYKNAKNEILQYIKDNKNKRPYISELAEYLQIDMELIEKILDDIYGG
jgi:hypothetical protein